MPVTFDGDNLGPESLERFYRGAAGAPWHDTGQVFLDDPLNRIRTSLILEQIALLKPRALLDAGCGAGALLSMIAEKGLAEFTTGCDFNPFKSTSDSNANRKFSLTTGDINKLPFASRSFDCVLCSETLEHLESPDAALAEFKRVLGGGGSLLVTVPNLFCLDSIEGRAHIFKTFGAALHKAGITSKFRHGINTHLQKYPPSVWRRMIENGGFKIEYGQPVYVFPYLPYFAGILKKAESGLFKIRKIEEAQKCLDKFSRIAPLGQLHFFMAKSK